MRRYVAGLLAVTLLLFPMAETRAGCMGMFSGGGGGAGLFKKFFRGGRGGGGAEAFQVYETASMMPVSYGGSSCAPGQACGMNAGYGFLPMTYSTYSAPVAAQTYYASYPAVSYPATYGYSYGQAPMSCPGGVCYLPPQPQQTQAVAWAPAQTQSLPSPPVPSKTLPESQSPSKPAPTQTYRQMNLPSALQKQASSLTVTMSRAKAPASHNCGCPESECVCTDCKCGTANKPGLRSRMAPSPADWTPAITSQTTAASTGLIDYSTIGDDEKPGTSTSPRGESRDPGRGAKIVLSNLIQHLDGDYVPR
jgi:hypothetical protein